MLAQVNSVCFTIGTVRMTAKMVGFGLRKPRSYQVELIGLYYGRRVVIFSESCEIEPINHEQRNPKVWDSYMVKEATKNLKRNSDAIHKLVTDAIGKMELYNQK